MTPVYSYELRFFDDDVELKDSRVTFRNYTECLEAYNTLDGRSAHLVPESANRVERHAVTVAVLPTPRRRSVVSGRFKAVQ